MPKFEAGLELELVVKVTIAEVDQGDHKLPYRLEVTNLENDIWITEETLERLVAIGRTPIKVGDRVVVVANDDTFNAAHEGRKGTVKDIDDDTSYPVNVDLDGLGVDYFHFSHLKVIEE